jgi:hypothetical protein
LQVHCSRSYSGDYDEGYRFNVAEVILETIMKVAGSLLHHSLQNNLCYSEPATFIIVSRITSATVNLQPSS